jgi:hypothetical protein
VSGSMLEAEEAIVRAVNAVGNIATAEALKGFDSTGRATRWRSRLGSR